MKKKRPILIQGAMEVEIKTIKDNIRNRKQERIDGYEFYYGELEGYPVIISKTEIGIMNTAVATYIGIKHFEPCMIINQGTAGGFGEDVHRGDLIVAKDCFCLNSYKTDYLKKGEGSNPFNWKLQTFYDGVDRFEKLEASKELISLIKKVVLQHSNFVLEDTTQNKDSNFSDTIKKQEKVIFGTIGSGDCWNQEIDYITYLNKEYGALCEDMETIGAYKVASCFKTPVIGIRVVSDNEILQEEYDKTLASKVQDFVILLCKEWIREGNY